MCQLELRRQIATVMAATMVEVEVEQEPVNDDSSSNRGSAANLLSASGASKFGPNLTPAASSPLPQNMHTSSGATLSHVNSGAKLSLEKKKVRTMVNIKDWTMQKMQKDREATNFAIE